MGVVRGERKREVSYSRAGMEALNGVDVNNNNNNNNNSPGKDIGFVSNIFVKKSFKINRAS